MNNVVIFGVEQMMPGDRGGGGHCVDISVMIYSEMIETRVMTTIYA